MAEVIDLVNEVDDDCSGEVEFNEFVTLMTRNKTTAQDNMAAAW